MATDVLPTSHNREQQPEIELRPLCGVWEWYCPHNVLRQRADMVESLVAWCEVFVVMDNNRHCSVKVGLSASEVTV